MTHWFHEKFLLELQLYDVVLYTSSASAVGRRIQELSKWPRISWYGRVSEWQKTTRRIAEEKLIIHLYGIQQTGMEKEIKVLLFFNIQWFVFENQQSHVYEANLYFLRRPDRCWECSHTLNSPLGSYLSLLSPFPWGTVLACTSIVNLDISKHLSYFWYTL